MVGGAVAMTPDRPSTMPKVASFATRVLAGKLYGIPSCDVNEYQIQMARKAAALYRQGKSVATIVKTLGIKPVVKQAPALAVIPILSED